MGQSLETTRAKFTGFFGLWTGKPWPMCNGTGLACRRDSALIGWSKSRLPNNSLPYPTHLKNLKFPFRPAGGLAARLSPILLIEFPYAAPSGHRSELTSGPSHNLACWLGCIIANFLPRPPGLATAVCQSRKQSIRQRIVAFRHPQKPFAPRPILALAKMRFWGRSAKTKGTGVFPMHSIGRVSRGNSGFSPPLKIRILPPTPAAIRGACRFSIIVKHGASPSQRRMENLSAIHRDSRLNMGFNSPECVLSATKSFLTVAYAPPLS